MSINILVSFPRLNLMINHDLLGAPLSLAVFLYLFRFKLDIDVVQMHNAVNAIQFKTDVAQINLN